MDAATLRKLREDLNWSLAYLAKKARVHLQTIHRIEIGETDQPRLTTVQKLTVALREGKRLDATDPNSWQRDEKRKEDDGSSRGDMTLFDQSGGKAPVGLAHGVNHAAAEVPPHGTTPAVSDRADLRTAIQALWDAAGRFDGAAQTLRDFAAGLGIGGGKAQKARRHGPGHGKKS